jgi:NAD(P)-dependent dehydrogenase (short-subunit alcohol dehydrogenase family)
MKDKAYGRFLFTSSAAGLFGNFGQSNYGAAKMGLVGLSNVLAVEGARHNIQANAIAPAAYSRLSEGLLEKYAETLSPDHVTPMALYLVSEASDITHEVYSVGGGRFARVFLALSPGWAVDNGTMATLEDVRDNIDQIRSEAGYIVPSSLADEMPLIIGRAG